MDNTQQQYFASYDAQFSKQVVMKVFKYTLFINKSQKLISRRAAKFIYSPEQPNLLLYVSIIKLTSIWWVNDCVNNVHCPYPS